MNAMFQLRNGHLYERAVQFGCPCCRQPLWMSKDANPNVFCGNDKCESRVTEAGASAATLDEAVELLAAAFKEEQLREYFENTLLTDHDCIA